MPTAPTCRWVECLVVYYDAFAHLLKIHAILVCRLLLLGGFVGFPRGIFLLHTGKTESQSGVVGEAWPRMAPCFYNQHERAGQGSCSICDGKTWGRQSSFHYVENERAS